MAVSKQLSSNRTRLFGAGSAVGVLVGIASIVFGGAAFTTVGVVLITLSVIAFLLAVGFSLSDPDGAEGG